MGTFEQLYGAWVLADEVARSAESELMTAVAASPEAEPALRERASALRDAANRLLDQAMARMRQESQPPRRRWPFLFAA